MTFQYKFVSMTHSELLALTRLLDDPDDLIYKQISDKIISLGENIIPLLQSTWGNSRDIVVNNRIESIVDAISFKSLFEEFAVWNSKVNPSLFDALVIINKIQYPNVNCKTYYYQIDDKVREIWLELSENLTSFEKVNVINKVLFNIWKFRSVNENAYDVFQYNFLSNLMELKCGNQFSISCLYLVLAERLDLPIYPVLLEDQLILAYADTHRPVEEIESDDILFYINPGENGAVFDMQSIKHWIHKHSLENNASYYLPSTTNKMVEKYIERLIKGYEDEKDSKKVAILSSLKK